MRQCCKLLTCVAIAGLIHHGWSQAKNTPVQAKVVDSAAPAATAPVSPASVKAAPAKVAPAKVAPVKVAPAKATPATAATAATAPATAAPIDTSAAQEKAATAEAKTEIDYKKAGDQYARQGQTDKAIAAYRQWIEQNASDSAASRIARMLGLYCFAKKKYDDASKYLLMMKGKAKDPAIVIILGKALQYSGKSKEAIETLEPLAANPKLTPDVRKDALKTLGDANVKMNSTDKAMAWYVKYLKAGGAKTADIMFVFAHTQEGAAPLKARKLYEENIKKFPADFRNYLHLGVLLSKSKQTQQRSAALLKKAASLAGSQGQVWLEIGRAYGAMGRTDDELSAYNTCIRSDTFNIEARTRVGTILLKRGQTTDALQLLEEVHAKFPDSLGPMTALAAAYIKTGRAKEAMELLIKTKAVKPKDPAIRKNLFDAYMATNQDQLALEEIKALLEIKRDNESLLAYGKLLLKLGKLDEAANTMQDIRATAPDNIEALMTLAKILREQKKFDEAIDVYKEINSIDGTYAASLYERAEVHRLQNKVKWAEEFYKRALQADPKMGLAELGLAKLALLYKNRTVYLEHLDKAASLDPDNPIIKQEMENSRNVQ